MRNKLFNAINLSVFSLAAVSLIYFILYYYSRAYISDYKEAYPPTGQLTEFNGINLHLIHKGAGEPLFLIHGSRSVYEDFGNKFIDSLQRRYEVFAFDRPGYGYSDAASGNTNLETNSQLISLVMDHFRITKALICGNDYGATIALRFAEKHPENVSGLILISPDLSSVTYNQHPLDKLYRLPVLGSVMLNSLYVPHNVLIRDIEERKQKSKGISNGSYSINEFPVSPYEYKAFSEELSNLEDELGGLKNEMIKINAPVLAVFGSYNKLQEQIRSEQNAIKKIPNSTYIVYNENGRNICYNKVNELLTDINIFSQKLNLTTTFNNNIYYGKLKDAATRKRKQKI